MKDPEWLEIPITGRVAAKVLGLSYGHFQKLQTDGWIPKGDGNVTPPAVVRGYVRYLKDEARRGMTTTTDQELKAERAAMLKLTREHKQGNLVDLEEHRQLFDEFSGVVRVAMAQLPAEITRDQAERTRIEAICDRTLGDIAARFEQSARDIAAYLATAEAGATSDTGRMGQEIQEISG